MTFPQHIKILKRKIFASKYGWSGDYKSWDKAKQTSTGYDASLILEKVKTSTLKVKKGDAVFERDSVLFDTIEYSWPLLASLMWIAARNKGKLSVIDFGGSLGSSYFQNRYFLSTLEHVQWSVIEQKSFVECGRQYFEDAELKFFYNIEACIEARGIPDVLLVSCALPYLEQPLKMLSDFLHTGIPYFIIDNTPFNYQDHDRISVQRVDPVIYEASYPCWFLNYNKVKAIVLSNYTIINEYFNNTSIILDGRKIPYRGLLAKLKSNIR